MSRNGQPRSEVRAALELRDREGLTFDELSERTGISSSTLARWSRRLRAKADVDQGFVEVAIVDQVDARAGSVAIRCDPFLIEVTRESDPVVLRRVLEVFADLSC